MKIGIRLYAVQQDQKLNHGIDVITIIKLHNQTLIGFLP